MDEPEFLSEEEELEWHENAIREIAKAEYKRIVQRTARGDKPDVIDRILLRMSGYGVGKPTKRPKSTRKE